MSPVLVCPSCNASLPLEDAEGGTLACDCGERIEGLDGLGTGGRSGERRSEKDVQLAIKRHLDTLGFHVSDLSQPRASMQTFGLPDLWVMHPRLGLAFWIEVKGPSTPLSGAQKAWHALAETAGSYVVVARSVEDVTEALARMGAVEVS